MRTFILLFLTMFSAVALNAQTVENPYFKSSDDPGTSISKIEITAKHTVITFETTPSGDGWINLNRGIYLQEHDGYKMYKFIKAEGIPLAPDKKSVTANSGKISFKVYFEKLPSSVKTINIIERAAARDEPVRYFNFFGVSLDEKGRVKNRGRYQEI